MYIRLILFACLKRILTMQSPASPGDSARTADDSASAPASKRVRNNEAVRRCREKSKKRDQERDEELTQLRIGRIGAIFYYVSWCRVFHVPCALRPLIAPDSGYLRREISELRTKLAAQDKEIASMRGCEHQPATSPSA
jgi:hypothetical protein